MYITYKKEVTENVNDFDFDLLIDNIYRNRISTKINFDYDNNQDEAYISIDFDEDVKDKASVYIDLNNIYTRQYYTKDELMERIREEWIL